MSGLVQKKDNKIYVCVGFESENIEGQFKDHITYVRQSCGGDLAFILAEKTEALEYLEQNRDKESLDYIKEQINKLENE